MSRSCFHAALFLAVALCAVAQTPDTAVIRGRVVDSSQAAVPGVNVTLTNSLTGLKRTAASDNVGIYTFGGLPVAGAYELTAAKSGFADATSGRLELAGGTTAEVNLTLAPAGAQASVTITGAVGEIRPDSPQLGNYLSAAQIAETPLPNDRITFLPLLDAANRPAINQGDIFMNENMFTTNGAGRRQAWFEIDGVNGNDSWGRQTIFTNLPSSSVEAMTILENSFTAEYGGSTGSAINIITKTGGDVFHGDAQILFRPEATSAALSGFTSANAANGNAITSDSLIQPSASLSGPIDSKTHFFAAADFGKENRISPVTSPIDPMNYVGEYRGWLGFLRVDRQLNDKNILFFRGSLDSFHDTNPNGIVGGQSLPTVARVFRRRTFAMELGETATLTPHWVNSARAQLQLAVPITQFIPVVYGTQYQVPISTGGTFTSGTSQSALLQNHQFELNDTLAASLGKHQLRFGADMIRAHTGGDSKEFGGPIYLGQFVYNTCTQPLTVCEGSAYLNNIANVKSYTQSYGNANYTVDDTLWALFIQDDYHVLPNLTVNLGLRYERQTFTDSTKDFAPRVGFAYNIHGDGKTVIRGGFGIYYSQIVDNSAANWALSGPTGVFNYTATPGQVGFPTTVASAPLPAFPSNAVAPVRTLYVRPGQASSLDAYFPTSTLVGYQSGLYSPYSEQWTFGVERQLARKWVLRADYVGTHTIKINRPLDVDAPAPFIRTAPNQIRTAQAANCTRPYWIWWYQQHGTTCNPSAPTNPQPPYAVIQSDVNDGYVYYHALDVNLSRRFGERFSMLASYVWSHSIDNVDPDIPGQNPNDANFTGRVENANAIFDQRHRFVLSGTANLPLKIHFGGIATLASGLPYNYTTGTTNSGDTGGTTDRPVIGSVVVGRNAGRGNPIYDFTPFLERAFPFTERFRLNLRAEAFNVFNHPNFVGYSGTYGNGAAPGAGFGAPLTGITNQLPARSLQFSAKFSF
ncbi:MAG TPA: TonB-dependent receptor [Bryobacteraceae bacterium]|jgi:hypothetical protein